MIAPYFPNDSFLPTSVYMMYWGAQVIRKDLIAQWLQQSPLNAILRCYGLKNYVIPMAAVWHSSTPAHVFASSRTGKYGNDF